MVVANLAVRFVVELVALAAVGYWSFNATDTGGLRFVLAGIAVTVFIAGWGLVLAPTADSGLGKAQKDLIGTVVLLAAAGALAVAGQPALAAGFAVIIAVNAVLLFVLGDAPTMALGGRH
jgi:hypothetical protein